MVVSYCWLSLYITTGLAVATTPTSILEGCTKAELDELKTLVRNAFQRNKCDEAVGQLVTRQSLELSTLKSELTATTATTARLEAELQALKTSGIEVSGGMAGIASGKQYNQAGSGNNRLCLTRTPQFDDIAKPINFGELYGAEYEHIIGHHNQDVPCSVCLVPRSVNIMMPATLTCPTGWTSLYTGHLASQYVNHQPSDYVCLDANPENEVGGVDSLNGNLFYYTVTQCGILPCPPYVNNKVVTCVVCSL